MVLPRAIYGSWYCFVPFCTKKKYTKNSYICSNLARLQVSYDQMTTSPLARIKTESQNAEVSACNACLGDAPAMPRHARLSTNNPMTHCDCSNGGC